MVLVGKTVDAFTRKKKSLLPRSFEKKCQFKSHPKEGDRTATLISDFRRGGASDGAYVWQLLENLLYEESVMSEPQPMPNE